MRAAEKSIERGREVNPGTSIGYIIRKGPGMISDRAEPIEDAKIDDIDVDYYIENQLLPPVARILEALGYSKEHLKGGLVQNNLKKWFWKFLRRMRWKKEKMNSSTKLMTK